MEEISYANPQESGKRRLPKRLLVFGGLFIVILVLLGSAIYFITQDKSPQADEVTKSITLPPDQEVTPTPEESLNEETEKEITKVPTEEPTPSKESNKSDISISVQNGSGVSGAAGEAADILRSAGFSIASTANPDNTNYSDVTIKIKNSLKTSLSDIEDALSDDYTIGSTSTDLPESTSYDVLVIIGS
jgi:hypothetical protein